MQTVYVGICVYSTCVCLAKTFRKIKLIIAYVEIVCTGTGHVHTQTQHQVLHAPM